MTDPVLDENGNEVVAPVVEQTQSNFEDLLATITASDGRQKYSDVQTALESITHKDEHINTLEADNATLRAEVEKREGLQEVLEQIKAQQAETTEVTPSVSGLESDTVLDMIKAALETDKTQTQAKQNAAAVFDALNNKYSDKGMVIFESQASELGMTPEALTKLASTSPKAVFKMLGLDHKKDVTKNLTSSVNTATLEQHQQQQPERKKVMLGASTKDIVSAWNRHKKTNE